MTVESDKQTVSELYGDPDSLMRIINVGKTRTLSSSLCDTLCSNKGKPDCTVVATGERPVDGYCEFFSLSGKESSVEKFEKKLVSLIVNLEKHNNRVEHVSKKFN